MTDSFDAEFHSSANRPTTLVRAHDTRLSTCNVLSHAVSNAIDAVAALDRQNLRPVPAIPSHPAPYLLTGLSVFLSHEPCLLCSMSLLHSRVASVYYVKSTAGAGGLGSVHSVHEEEGLNHRFEVWQWRGGPDIGEGLDIQLDP